MKTLRVVGGALMHRDTRFPDLNSGLPAWISLIALMVLNFGFLEFTEGCNHTFLT